MEEFLSFILDKTSKYYHFNISVICEIILRLFDFFYRTNFQKLKNGLKEQRKLMKMTYLLTITMVIYFVVFCQEKFEDTKIVNQKP